MKFKLLNLIVIASCFTGFSQIANSHALKCGELNVAHPYSIPTLSGSKNGAAYFMAIKNNGKEVDQLLGAKGNVSSSVEIHEMQLENNVMKMRAVTEVQLPVGYEVTFKHGQANGYHLMLIDLKKSLKQGDKFALTLNFKKAGDCQAEFWVEAPKSDSHKH
jgi:copper(I)-binding protein